MQMYKVFYKKNFLLIGDKNTKCNACLPINIIDNSFINEFTDDKCINNYFLFTEDSNSVINKLIKHINYIKAAGGLVINNNNEILLIKHYNIWDLPKGWIEKNENDEAAATREVQEECGITNHNITKKLDDSFHIYKHNGKLNLKHSIWFLMKYNGTETLTPQTDEDISEAIWVPISNLPKYYNNMYESVIDLIAKSI